MIKSLYELGQKEDARLKHLALKSNDLGEVGDIYSARAYVGVLSGNKDNYQDGLSLARTTYIKATQSNNRAEIHFYLKRQKFLNNDMFISYLFDKPIPSFAQDFAEDIKRLVNNILLERASMQESYLNIICSINKDAWFKSQYPILQTLKDKISTSGEPVDFAYRFGQIGDSIDCFLQRVIGRKNHSPAIGERNYKECCLKEDNFAKKCLNEVIKITGFSPSNGLIQNGIEIGLEVLLNQDYDKSMGLRQVHEWLSFASEEELNMANIPQITVDHVGQRAINKFASRYVFDECLPGEQYLDILIDRLGALAKFTGKKPSKSSVNEALKPLYESFDIAGNLHSEDGPYKFYNKSSSKLNKAIRTIKQFTNDALP